MKKNYFNPDFSVFVPNSGSVLGDSNRLPEDKSDNVINETESGL